KVVSSSMVNSIRNGAGSLIARMMNAPTILYLSMATYLSSILLSDNLLALVRVVAISLRCSFR
ncbi:hypothetical protein, partial [Leptolyngbya sp. FACHB-321]|uniref:hypothetical protein n=1 Tax=Leptolyngbya sp. FACHB-321 TaxID=2692807 RepID=UPI001A7E945D